MAENIFNFGRKWQSKNLVNLKKKQYLCSVKENLKIVLIIIMVAIIAITIGMTASYVMMKFTNLI